MELIGLVKPEMSAFAQAIYEQKYAWKDEEGNVVETWEDTVERVVSNVMGALGYAPGDLEYDRVKELMVEKKFLPGGRYLYAAGRPLHQTQNCLLLRAEDSREGWAVLMYKAGMALMTGAGIGVDYSDVRESGAVIAKTGGVASGPLSLMKILNESGRNIQQGGSRRSAIWAGLSWKHPDVFDFIRVKDWSPEIRALKEQDFNFPAALDMTNISVLLDDDFFEYMDGFRRGRKEDLWAPDGRYWEEWATDVYWTVVKRMLKTGEPGFSIDVGENAGETLRNACTEITSRDDSDICNLGSVNLARIDNIDEFEEAVKYGTLFLLAGTVYSHLPYDQVHEVRAKNRRLGLGVMGVHEWLASRGKKYGPDEELGDWLMRYTKSTRFAQEYADLHGLSEPVKTRAIAPNGTIGIIGETTTSMEPIFCVAYKRRYRSARPGGDDRIQFQYVVDPCAKRLVDEGVDPYDIEDAYSLSFDVERRVAFQAWMQQFVDHGISSTINLPSDYGENDFLVQEFGEMLIKYLPKLRGITCYPDGARGGQPLTPVGYNLAVEHDGVVFEENEERCINGACGV